MPPAPPRVDIGGFKLTSVRVGDERGGEEAVQALRKASDAQECPHESPEGTSPAPLQLRLSLVQLFYINVDVGSQIL